MADEVKKGADQASGQEGVKEGTEGSTVKELSAEDIVALTEALKMSLEREKKTAEERDNYKEGMLKAKGKLKTDEEEEGSGGEKKTEGSSELADIVKALLKQNQEITVAAVNRSQIATAGQGGSSEAKVEVGDNMFSAAQLKELKAKGWDDKKIARLKQNILNSRG